MTYPLEINSRFYQDSDFLGKAYVTGFPDLVSDFAIDHRNRSSGFVRTPRFIPRIKYAEFTGPKNRTWATGGRLVFVRQLNDSSSEGGTFLFTVTSYEPSTGQLTGNIDAVAVGADGIAPGSLWLVFAAARPEVMSSASSFIQISEGGLAQSLLSRPMAARVSAGKGSPASMFEVFEDFDNFGTVGRFEVSGAATATRSPPLGGVITRADTCGVIRLSTLNLNDWATFQLASKDLLFINDFEFHARIWISNLSDATHRQTVQIGYSSAASASNDIFSAGGMGAEYNLAAASATFWARVAGNNAAPTRTTSAVTVAAGSWLKYSLVKTGTSVVGSINGTAVSTTLTSGYPTTHANNNYCAPMLSINRVLGSGVARSVYMDYMFMRHK